MSKITRSIKPTVLSSVLLAFLPSSVNAMCLLEWGSLKIGHITIDKLGIDPVDNVYYYSDTLDIDNTYASAVTGSSGIGSWAYEYVNKDYTGANLANGLYGIRFFLQSGDGISAGEYADFSFSAKNTDKGLWYSDYHDSASNTWASASPCAECTPTPIAPSFLLFLSSLPILGALAIRGRHNPSAVGYGMSARAAV